MGFYGFRCRRCGKPLPAELKDNNYRMVRIWCFNCKRWTYINGLKVVEDMRKPRGDSDANRFID